MSSTKRVRILKACPWVESSDLEEFSIALDAPIYPPRPYLLAFSPASDFHSPPSPSSFSSGVESAEVTAREDIATVARQLAALTQTVEEMAGQLKEVRERAENERERTDASKSA